MRSAALIGCGSLGRCLLKGLLSAGCKPQHLKVVEQRAENRDRLQRDYPEITVERAPSAMLKNAAAVLLCVKPQDLRAACRQILPHLRGDAMLISTAAGVRCRAIQKWTMNRHKVVRCMPNIAAAVGCSMSVLCSAEALSREQKETAAAVFAAVGQTEWVEEEQMMDLVTALSGSGPAYFFRFIEALVKAAQARGMPAERACRLTMQTAAGALLYLQKSGESASRARQKVTSAGGTTERALAVLEKNHFDAGIEAAVKAAQGRAREISDYFDQE